MLRVGRYGAQLIKAQSLTARCSYSALAITDPLVIYENKIANKSLLRDEAQHRAAIELQKLYNRLKDYNPPTNFRKKIRDLSLALEEHERKQEEEEKLNPEAERKAWYLANEESRELIKQLSAEEELLNFDSPQGLLLHGEVGCGKSMLMDMFADSLPHVSKKRWHYNNFMLSIYGHIHQISEQRRNSGETGSKLRLENDYILLELAERMIDQNTVLLLDEFMLPDIAAAKIVQTLFVFFFKLGGVLVATSNRLPEELYATDFRKAQFATFFRILQARCVSHDMRSENDYREILSDPANAERLLVKPAEDGVDSSSAPIPQIDFYHVKDTNTTTPTNEDKWADAIQELTDTDQFFTPQSDSLTVYGRKVVVPWHHNGTAFFDFEDICGSPLAAADYISIASRYHTVILDNVPALKMTQKNEARRLITLLDALYECRCKLLIRAEAVPEDLFFADIRDQIREAEDEQAQSLDQEMFSEVHQDLSSPFRPNVASYENNDRETTPEKEQKEQKKHYGVNNNDESYISEDPSNKFFPQTKSTKPQQDFTKISAFTGEDERFAYKRAVSRLKEMTGSTRWVQENEWQPLDEDSRPWETISTTSNYTNTTGNHRGLTGPDSMFRTRTDRPPKFDAQHFWAMVEWGPGKRIQDEHAKKWIRGNEIYKK